MEVRSRWEGVRGEGAGAGWGRLGGLGGDGREGYREKTVAVQHRIVHYVKLSNKLTAWLILVLLLLLRPTLVQCTRQVGFNLGCALEVHHLLEN